MPVELDADRWYWDERTQKALLPRRIDDDTVQFLTVWHAEEVDDALATDALVPIEEVGLDRTDTTFDLVDSFRLPELPGTDTAVDSSDEAAAERE